ncbi:TPA: CXXX repeat peptide modification system protein [Streptococcus agalactiae]
MERNILVTVKEEEKQEIQDLFERINALKSLAMTLADNNLEFEKHSLLYEKLIKDLQESNKKYEQWWSNIANKYTLDVELLKKATIDFSSNEIFI